MLYRHKIVEALAKFIQEFGGGGKDPIMRAIWAGLRSQVPGILRVLDENDELVEELRVKLLDALDLMPPQDTEQLLTEPETESLPEPVLEEKPKKKRKGGT